MPTTRKETEILIKCLSDINLLKATHHNMKIDYREWVVTKIPLQNLDTFMYFYDKIMFIFEMNENLCKKVVLDHDNLKYILDNTDMLSKFFGKLQFIFLHILNNADINVIHLVINKIHKCNEVFSIKHIPDERIFDTSPWIRYENKFIQVISKILKITYASNNKICKMIKILCKCDKKNMKEFRFQLLSLAIKINSEELINDAMNMINCNVTIGDICEHVTLEALIFLDNKDIVKYPEKEINGELNALIKSVENMEMFKYIYYRTKEVNKFKFGYNVAPEYIEFITNDLSISNDTIVNDEKIKFSLYGKVNVFSYFYNKKILTIEMIMDEINNGRWFKHKVLKHIKDNYQELIDNLNYDKIFYNSLHDIKSIKYLRYNFNINMNNVVELLRENNVELNKEIVIFLNKQCNVDKNTLVELKYHYNIDDDWNYYHEYAKKIGYTYDDVKDDLPKIFEIIKKQCHTGDILYHLIKTYKLHDKIIDYIPEHIGFKKTVDTLCKYIPKQKMIEFIPMFVHTEDIICVIKKYKIKIDEIRKSDYELIKKMAPIKSKYVLSFLIEYGFTKDDFVHLVKLIVFDSLGIFLEDLHEKVNISKNELSYDNNHLLKQFVIRGYINSVKYMYEKLQYNLQDFESIDAINICQHEHMLSYLVNVIGMEHDDNDDNFDVNGSEYYKPTETITPDDMKLIEIKNNETYICGICKEHTNAEYKYVMPCCNGIICVECGQESVGKQKRECAFCRKSIGEEEEDSDEEDDDEEEEEEEEDEEGEEDDDESIHIDIEDNSLSIDEMFRLLHFSRFVNTQIE